jgi:GNAT superfamily N-acetyltransferase
VLDNLKEMANMYGSEEEKTLIKHIDVTNTQHKEAFVSLFDEYVSALPVEAQSEVVNQLFALPYFHGFICFVDNEPAAFAVCFESYSTYRARKVLNIHDFMVSAVYRGQGVGKQQLKFIEQYCRENNYLKITLEVDDENKSAQQLYATCGFEDFKVVLKGLNHWQKYLQ